VPEFIRPALALSDSEIVESIDTGTAEIFGALSGQHVLCAQWTRLVADLNRGPGERGRNGVIPEVDYSGRWVYVEAPLLNGERFQDRLREYYWPYHDRLEKMVNQEEIRGLFDCHSLNAVAPVEAPDAGKSRKDIILGNNGDAYGEAVPGLGKLTCPSEGIQVIKQIFVAEGFSVDINFPYAGGFITRHYGARLMAQGKFAVQIEINQALFMDEQQSKMVPDRTKRVRRKMARCLEAIARVRFFASPPRHFLIS
jgi:N-formylglutamate amidohydrolase